MKDNVLPGPWGKSNGNAESGSSNQEPIESVQTSCVSQFDQFLSSRSPEDVLSNAHQHIDDQFNILLELALSFENQIGSTRQQVWLNNRKQFGLDTMTDLDIIKRIVGINQDGLNSKPKYYTTLLGEYSSRDSTNAGHMLKWKAGRDITVDDLCSMMGIHQEDD